MSQIVYSIGLIISVRERKFHANIDVENESSQDIRMYVWIFSIFKIRFF